MAEMNTRLHSLADDLLEAACIKFGNFTLHSRLQSPIYIDLRRIIAYPKLLADIANAYLHLLSTIHFSRIAGLHYAAIPIASPDDAKKRLALGASLVQVYTGLVYRGPGLTKQIIESL